MFKFRKRKLVIAGTSLFVGLPLVAASLLYAELRWTAKQYTGVSRNVSSPARSSDMPTTLRTVFLNTHLLPLRLEKIAGNRSDGMYRAEQIAEELLDHDLIALCEAFDPKCLQRLIDVLQQRSGNAFSVISSPVPPRNYLLSSGCVLLSRYPIESADFVTYSASSTFWQHGFFADGFAAKGAILARIRWPGYGKTDFPLTCVVTHLEARSPECRGKQINEIAGFMSDRSVSAPLIVMGDFNIAAEDSPAYTNLRNTLSTNGIHMRDAWEQKGAPHGGTSEPTSIDGGNRIDYVFYEPGSGNGQIQLSNVNVLRLLNEQVGSLSDHAAVEATFTFRKPQSED